MLILLYFSCWISTDEGALWAFVGPMLAIITVSWRHCIYDKPYCFRIQMNIINHKISILWVGLVSMIMSINCILKWLKLWHVTWLFYYICLGSACLNWYYLSQVNVFFLFMALRALFMSKKSTVSVDKSTNADIVKLVHNVWLLL